MDKLKPLIEHHFWIMFFVVLLLPVIGWWPTANGLRDETEKQISAIDSAFSAVPSGSQANQSWSTELNKIAEKAEGQNQEERVFLWERQWKMMTWPNTMQKKHLPEAYRDVINLTSRNVYKGVYDLQVEKVWKAADPFDYETGKGTVLLDLKTVPREKFDNQTPTSEELWDAQEDLWLLESLFKSIKEANQGAANLTKSVLRRIDLIELVGGPGDYPDAESSSAGSGSGGGFDGGGSDEMTGMMNLGGNGSGGGDGDGDGGSFGGGRATVSAGNVSFDPADEFGDEQGRYIKFEKGTIYRKRGFYLEGIVDHERLPDLLVSLTNGNWPVTITRVQMVKLGSSGKSSSQTGGFPGGNSFEAEMDMQESGGNFGQGIGGGRLSSATLGTGGNSRNRGSGKSEHTETARAAVNGNSLAKVAISGIIYIYNPPEISENAAAVSDQEEIAPEETTMGQPEQETPAASDTPAVGDKQEAPAKPDSATPASSESKAKEEKPDSQPAESEKPAEDNKNAEKKPASEPIPKPKAENP